MGKTIGMILGAVFIIVGILGFVTNPIVGEGAIFQTNLAHDLVHLISGILFIIFAMKSSSANSMFMKVFGIIYLLIALLGFFMVKEGGMLLGLIDTNSNDHWLHVVLGVVIFALGMMISRSNNNTMGSMSQTPQM